MAGNVSCPKCGGAAAEYPPGKWSCPACGHQFCHASPSAAGGPLTPPPDIDRQKVCPPTVVMGRKSTDDPAYAEALNRAAEAVRDAQKSLAGAKSRATVAVVTGMVFLVAAVAGAIVALAGSSRLRADRWAIWCAVFYALIFYIDARLTFRTYLPRWQRAKAEFAELRARQRQLAAEQNDPVVAGHHLGCPWCRAPLEYIPKASPLPTGLLTCPKCGKPFYTEQGHSYPVISTSNRSTP